MATTDYKFPWEWTHEYLKDRIRKNSVIEKRRKKAQKSLLKRYIIKPIRPPTEPDVTKIIVRTTSGGVIGGE